jgi:type I restriction enzyme M protein
MITKTPSITRDRKRPRLSVPTTRAAPPPVLRLSPLIDRLCDKLWAAGVTNPISYVEQISYLFFLKMLDEIEADKEREARVTKRPYKSIYSGKNERFRWSHWMHETNPKKLHTFLRDEVFGFMQKLRGREEIRKVFAGAALQIPDGHTLRDCIDLFRGYDFLDLDTDAKGTLYENLLRRVGTQAQAGQFLTPRHLIRAIVRMVDPKIGQTVYDPAFGTGGFLIAAYEHIKLANSDEKNTYETINGNGQIVKRGYGDRLSPAQWQMLEHGTIHGCDVDPHIVRLGMMNLILHGLENSDIRRRDSIAGPRDDWDDVKFDVILANPPFAGSMNKERIRDSLPVPSTKTEILFLGAMIKALRDGGTCGVIVPEGLLFGSSGSHREVRRLLLEECDVQAVVSFPAGSFKPYTGVKTSALIFRRGQATKKLWFYEVTADGFSLDDNRRPIAENDLPDLVESYENGRKVTAKSWVATIKEIEEADYNLTTGRYRPASKDVASHDAPTKLLQKVVQLEDQIAAKAKTLLRRIETQ